MEVKCQFCNRKYNSSSLKFCPNCGHAKKFSENAFDEARIIRPKIADISNKINTLRTKYTSEGFPYNDIRNQTLGSTFTLLAWIHDQLDVYVQLYSTSRSPGAAKIIQSNPDMKRPQIEELFYHFGMILKSSFLFHFMNRIENCIKKINYFLTNEENRIGYKQSCKDLKKNLEFKTDTEYNILYFPYLVRNSMHNEGIHKDKFAKGIIDKYTFTFHPDKTIHYYSWNHIVFFCDKIIEVFEKIFDVPSIKNEKIQAFPYEPPEKRQFIY